MQYKRGASDGMPMQNSVARWLVARDVPLNCGFGAQKYAGQSAGQLVLASAIHYSKTSRRNQYTFYIGDFYMPYVLTQSKSM